TRGRRACREGVSLRRPSERLAEAFRQWGVEVRGHPDLALRATGSAMRGLGQRYEASPRPAVLRDDDLLTRRRAIDKRGQLRLGGVEAEAHETTLAERAVLVKLVRTPSRTKRSHGCPQRSCREKPFATSAPISTCRASRGSYPASLRWPTNIALEIGAPLRHGFALSLIAPLRVSRHSTTRPAVRD